MDTFKDINEAPKEIREEVNHNSKDMHLFYSKSQVARDDILERIAGLNSKDELHAYEKGKRNPGK